MMTNAGTRRRYGNRLAAQTLQFILPIRASCVSRIIRPWRLGGGTRCGGDTGFLQTAGRSLHEALYRRLGSPRSRDEWVDGIGVGRGQNLPEGCLYRSVDVGPPGCGGDPVRYVGLRDCGDDLSDIE